MKHCSETDLAEIKEAAAATRVTWTRGHRENRWNDYADQRANEVPAREAA